MPVISLPYTSGSLLASSKTIQQLMTAIARPVSGTQDPVAMGALDALHMAMDWLLEEAWEFYHFRAANFQSTPDVADYSVPTRVNRIYNMRVTDVNPRPLAYIEKGLYDKMVFDQTATGTPTQYTLSKMLTSGLLTLLPTPNAVETYEMDIYREPFKDTDPAHALDIATWMERPIILQAQALVVKWRGGQPAMSDSLAQMSERAKQGALVRDQQPSAAEEAALIPFHVHGQWAWPWTHPMRDLEEDYS